MQGQDGAVNVLRRAVASDRLAGAYLFVGPGGVGKRTTAMALAKHVLRADPESARRIDALLHPDVRVFPPRESGKRNIPVDVLRSEVLPVAQFAPFEAPAAFLVFPEAEVSFPEHPPESANALLKTLEEPRPNVHFLLLSERPQRLLPTIRSRCQRLRFGRLSPAVLHRILEVSGVPEGERAAAVALADGRAERALALAEGGAEDLLEAALGLDEASTGGTGAALAGAEAAARGDQDVSTLLSTLQTFYRDVAATALGRPPETLAFPHRADAIRARARALGARRAATRVEDLGEGLLALERNGNPQIVLDGLLSAWTGES